jgi:hypothetical protein
MPPYDLHRHWHASPKKGGRSAPPSRAWPIVDEGGASQKETAFDNDRRRPNHVVLDGPRSRSDDDHKEMDAGGGSDGRSSGGSAHPVRPAYPHGLHRHWHASSSKTSGRSLTGRARPNDDGGGNRCPPPLEKIDEGSGSGSLGSSAVISQPSMEEKEKGPLEQFYDYWHQFYSERHCRRFDVGPFAAGRPGPNNVDDLPPGIESPWSFVALSSEALDGSSWDGDDAMATTSSMMEEERSQCFPPWEGGCSVDSFRTQGCHSPSNLSSCISTVSSVTRSRALNDDNSEWRARRIRGFYDFA